ncbi:MAG: tetratricopeptide repeat protein [Thermoanaerobaculum sp.]
MIQWVSAAAVMATFALPAGAASDPEEEILLGKFLDVARTSKYQYQLGDKPPKSARRSVPPRCSADGEETTLRCVREADGSKALVPWKLKPEAQKRFPEAEQLFHANKLEEALAAYDEVLVLEPDFAPAWLFSGDVPYHLGDYEEALRRFRKAIELDNTMAQAHSFSADALAHLGRQEEAVEEYLLAMVFRPTYTEAQEHLRDLLADMGYFFYRLPFEAPDDAFPGKKGKKIYVPAVGQGKNSTAWHAFSLCQAVWQFEPTFEPEKTAKDAPWNLGRDAQCVMTFWQAWGPIIEPLKKAKEEGKNPELADFSAPAQHVARVLRRNLLTGYVLVEYWGTRCPSLMRLLSDELIREALAYLKGACIVPDARREPPKRGR